MNKQQIVNHYFTNRAFNASQDVMMMSVHLRNAMPQMSSEQADEISEVFAKLAKGYMVEAEECAEKLSK